MTSSGRSLANIIIIVVAVAVVVGVVVHHHHHHHLHDRDHDHHYHHQVIDQHKEDFNPDNLRDFIDMFLLEVLKLHSLCV